jgi:hypothetical protein
MEVDGGSSGGQAVGGAKEGKGGTLHQNFGVDIRERWPGRTQSCQT